MDPQQLVPNSGDGLSKNPFKRVWQNIRKVWSGASRKKRLGVLLLTFLLIASGLLLYVIKNGTYNGLPGNGSLQEVILKQVSEGFERLKIPQREPPFFALTSKTKSKYGVFPKEIFVLTTKEPVDKSFLEQNIKSSVPVSLSSVSDTEYEITPKSPMGTDEVLNVSLAVNGKEDGNHSFDRNYGWTFQTQGKFRIKGTIPGDKKTNVPLNTGIEFTFSQDDFKDPSPLINVDPAFAYRTEIHGEVLSIVPLQPLEPETIYIITLSKGLNLKSRNDPIADDFSFTFQTQSKSAFENKDKQVLLSITNNFVQVVPTENPMVGVYTYNWKDDQAVNTKIYKFASGDEFVNSRKDIDKAERSWYSYFSEKSKVSTDGLSLVGSADIKVQNKEDVEYLQLPSSLDEGYYLIQFWFDDGKQLEQLWLQSSYLSAYTSVGRKQTLVWVNNLETHLPVDTAFVVSPGTNLSAVTNDKGISVFSTPGDFYDSGRHYLNITTSGGKSLYMPVNSLSQNSDSQKENKNDYWSYLYHERLIYKTGDTLYFWGVAKKRDGNSIPDSVTISVPSNSYGSEPKTTQTSVSVTPNSDGSFLGSLSLSGFSQGWYSLEMKVGDLEVTQSSFSVTDYTKPDMKIEMAPSKNAVFAGEDVKFSGKVTFFDETPAKGIALKVYSPDGVGTNDSVTTDNKGSFEYKYKSKYSGSTNYYPRLEGVTVNPALSENSNIEGYGSVRVYGSKLMLTTKGSQDGHKATFQGTVNKVDLTGINNGTSQDARGSTIYDKEVKIIVTKTWWETIEDGTYYDFVEKVTRPTYKYIRHDEKITDTTIKSNSEGEIAYNFDLEDQKSYELDAEVTDDDGHVVKVKRYYYYYSNGGYGNYQDDKYTAPEISLDSEENSFSLGESVDLSVRYKGEDYPDTDKNSFLFIIAERGTQKAVVEDTPKLSFEFSKEHIPNIYVASVVFTGDHYELTKTSCNYNWRCSYNSYYYEDYYFNGLEINYKQDDSKLDLQVVPESNKYSPGDIAKIKANVSKKGNPVIDADVNMVLVDAALEAIGGVKVPSVLSTLYATVPSEIYYNYYSHKSLFSKPPAAEMGGGGGPREIFKDTAFFGQQKTDSDGNAVFEFTLPDNITTWNIYTQSVSNNLDAGQSEGSLVVTKEFFVTSSFPQSVLAKDKVFVTANSFGTAVNPNQSVSYEFYMTSGETQFGRLTNVGTTSKDISFQVPELSAGSYKTVLTGKLGDLNDTLIYPLEVKDTRFDLRSDKTFSLSEGSELTDLGLTGVQKGSPVKLIITDAGKGKYYYSLFDYCYVYSNRLEKRIAKEKASQIISDRFNENVCKVNPEDFSGFQNFDGGLSQVSWGGSDLKTTVWALYVDKTNFDREKTKKYLQDLEVQGNVGTIQEIYVDWGLTLLGVPKVNDLRILAQNATTFEEKVIVALALSSAGETELSRELYYDVLADYGYTNKPYIRIQRNQDSLQGSSTDQLVEDSSYALLLGSLVEPTYNKGLYSYLSDYRYDANDVVIDLSKMAFIDQELTKLPDGDTQVSVKTSARNVTYDLKKGGRKVLSLDEGEIQNPVIRVSSGKAEVDAIFNITPDSLGKMTKDGRLTLNRTYKNTSGSDNIRPGDIVEVTVDFNLNFDKSPRGGFEIKDYLPSGLIFLKNPSLYGFSNASWVYQTEPNVIRYTFYNSPWWQKYGNKSFKYYARAVAVGTYVGESTTMQSKIDLSVMTYTPEDSVTINTQ